MGIGTKTVKRILTGPDLVYQVWNEFIASRADTPGVAVVFIRDRGVAVAVTVLPRIPEEYVRSDSPTGWTRVHSPAMVGDNRTAT